MQTPDITSEGEVFASPPAHLEYPFEAPPAHGETIEVAPGIAWLRMPMPMELDHINLWLLREPDGGTTLIDTGMPVPVCAQTWERRFAAGAKRPARIAVTHFHPDHMGLAGWLQAQSAGGGTTTPVWASRRTFAAWEHMAERWGGGARMRHAPFLESHGVAGAAELLAKLPMRSILEGEGLLRTPRIERWIGGEERLTLGGREWRTLEVHGHADGHLCYYCAELGVLISGDQVLPTISPNVGIEANQWGQDVLAEYLTSLRRLRSLPADTLVLPSHGRVFRGLHERIADLEAHHADTLATLLEAMATPRSARDLMDLLYGPRLRGFNVILGLQECLAHLEHLVATGRASRHEDEAGRRRYVRV